MPRAAPVTSDHPVGQIELHRCLLLAVRHDASGVPRPVSGSARERADGRGTRALGRRVRAAAWARGGRRGGGRGPARRAERATRGPAGGRSRRDVAGRGRRGPRRAARRRATPTRSTARAPRIADGTGPARRARARRGPEHARAARWDDQSIDDFHASSPRTSPPSPRVVDAALADLRARARHGRGVSSVRRAGPSSPGAGVAYAASKTALGVLCRDLNAQEAEHGVRATHLCPGDVGHGLPRPAPEVPDAAARERHAHTRRTWPAPCSSCSTPPRTCASTSS